MKYTLALAILAAAVQGHYTFPAINGGADWSNVRRTTNFNSNSPVTNVNDAQMRCYQAGGNAGAKTVDIKAGGTVTFKANTPIYHDGALSAYMAKVPAGSTAATWNGDGKVWYKVYQDMPTTANGRMVWPSLNKGSVSFQVPQCTEDGEYLFRIEHVALHQAGAPQFYISCAQIKVTGGSGSAKPTDLVAFPGAYTGKEPGLALNIYNNGGRAYQPAGPSVFKC